MVNRAGPLDKLIEGLKALYDVGISVFIHVVMITPQKFSNNLQHVIAIPAITLLPQVILQFQVMSFGKELQEIQDLLKNDLLELDLLALFSLVQSVYLFPYNVVEFLEHHFRSLVALAVLINRLLNLIIPSLKQAYSKIKEAL